MICMFLLCVGIKINVFFNVCLLLRFAIRIYPIIKIYILDNLTKTKFLLFLGLKSTMARFLQNKNYQKTEGIKEAKSRKTR
jgi:hypothetical protein